MRVVVDECVRRSWLMFLEQFGHEAIDWIAAAGQQGMPDEELVAWAAEAGAAVLTADNDLGQLLWAQGATGPTVAQLENPAWSPAEYGLVLLTALADCEEEPDQSFFVGVRANRTYRIRPLPLR